jgi:hypothetical protein
MYNERPEDIVKRHRTTISAVQIFSVIITVMMTLVLPIQLIEYNKTNTDNISPYSINSTQNPTGRVAGASTITQTQTPNDFNLAAAGETEIKILAGVAITLVALGGLIVLVLYSTKPLPEYPKMSKEFEFILDEPAPGR